MHGILILDFEASSGGRHGYPIEVAFSVPGSGRVASSLIRPLPSWEVAGLWDPAAQAVHGIERHRLEAEGRDPAVVAAAVLRACAGRTVLSDMPCLDGRLLRTLAGAAAPNLRDFWEEARRLGDRSREGAAVVDVDSEHPARHRAAADVRRLCFLWGKIVVGAP